VNLPRVKPGDPITADLVNALIDAARASQLSVGPDSGLVLTEGPEGPVLAAERLGFLWGKLTGGISGGTYPFTQQREDAGGTWVDGPITGAAYETTGNTALTAGTLVQLWRTAAGDWRFQASAC
jgi:hypothetical protein